MSEGNTAETIPSDVVLILRPDARLNPGGDTVQAEAIVTFLRRLGARVARYDTLLFKGQAGLGIVFNLTRPLETFVQAEALRRAGIPYILFPVFWDLAHVVPEPPPQRRWPQPLRMIALRTGLRYLRCLPQDVAAWLLTSPRCLALASPRTAMRAVVDNAAVVAPNSHAEFRHLAEYLGVVPDRRWVVVGNGLWAEDMPVVQPRDRRRPEVLCAGAIGPRKNQLTLVRAAHGLECPVRLIGAPAPGCDDYARRVAAEAPPEVEFLGPLPHNCVLDLMAHAQVHCQPSFIETPGLASLEAAACGAIPVVSEVEPVREYFGDHAYYATPASPSSIQEALRRALNDQSDCEFRAAWARIGFDWPTALAPLGDALARIGVVFSH